MKKNKLIITAVVLALILGIGGVLAYFTDTETKTNTFVTSKTKITVTEESFPPEGVTTPDGKVPVVPNQVIKKDPVVNNKGQGKVYAFAEVTIPKATVIIGNQTAASLQELFTTQYISTPATETTDAVYTAGINPAWIEIGTVDNAATSTEPASRTYKYAYATKDAQNNIVLTELDEDESTPAIFDSVTFVDVIEDDPDAANSVQGKDYSVTVSGYGIQTEGLDTADVATIFGYAKGNN